MCKENPGDGKALKRKVFRLLQAEDFGRGLEDLVNLPGRQVVNPLFSFLLSTDELVRWRAVTAMGEVVRNLAEQNMESARVVIRRLMWSLNDESGGIGWGAPEVLGEIMARHKTLAEEFAPILVSYCDENGNYLEYEPLQRGLLWGIVRLARVRPELLTDALPHLRPFLESSDPTIRGLAAWALGLLGDRASQAILESMMDDTTPVSIYLDGAMESTFVRDLAARALRSLTQ